MQSSQRIDPKEIKAAVGSKGKAQATGSSFGAAMDAAGAMAPFMGELAAQSTGSSSAASVMHAAFSAMPESYAAGKGGYYGYSGAGAGGDGLGIMGYSRYSTANPTADPSGLGVSQPQMIETMNQNNLKLLELQSMLQNNMQSWTTKSNVLKSSYEAKMNMINKFSVRG